MRSSGRVQSYLRENHTKHELKLSQFDMTIVGGQPAGCLSEALASARRWNVAAVFFSQVDAPDVGGYPAGPGYQDGPRSHPTPLLYGTRIRC